MRGAGMRAVLALTALAGLGACNMVMTQTPVFAASDAAGAPTLRYGVWREDGDTSCQFDDSQPMATWPDCANGVVIKRDALGAYHAVSGKKAWASTPYLLASGDPRVLQTHFEASFGDASLPPLYFYVALEPTQTDARGRITAFTGWSVLCGAPPPPGTMKADGKTTQNGTLQPLPGLTMDANGNDCTTTSPDAIRGAAKASRQWAKPSDLTRSRWVRDGDN